MTVVTVATEVTNRAGIADVLSLSLRTRRTSVRRLIERKLRAEIDAWRARERETFGVEYGERNVQRRPRWRRVTVEREVEKALSAFARQGFLVFVDGRQVSDPDEEFDVEGTTSVRFVRLVPLAGG